MTHNVTQKEKVLKYVDKYGSITPLEALKDLGIMRLAARIHELEKDGIKFAHDKESCVTRDGTIAWYSRYRRAPYEVHQAV